MDQTILDKIDSEKSFRTQARLSAMIGSLGDIDEVTDDTNDSIKEDREYQIIDSSSSSTSVSSGQFEPLRPTQLNFTSNIHTPPDQQLPSSFSSNSSENKELSNNNIVINNNNNAIDDISDFVPQPPPHSQFHPLTSVNITPSITTPTHHSNTNGTSLNRYSMLSDYSGVIHEGTEVSYIVKNKPANNVDRNNDQDRNSNSNDINNKVDTNNTIITVTTTDNLTSTATATSDDKNNTFGSNKLSTSSQPIAQNEVIIKQIKNARHVNRFNSLRSDTPSKPPKSHLKYHSDPLLLTQEQTREQLNCLSLEESLPSMLHDREESNLDDSFSIQSSVIHPLSTSNNIQNDKANRPIKPLLNEKGRNKTTIYKESINSINQANDGSTILKVPPRNKNRPKTMIIDQDISNPEIFLKRDSATLDDNNNYKNTTTLNNNGNGNSTNVNKQQFNVHTLSQLLSITNGTLIGSEFQDLPIPLEEKRALERLVDSLSRLTADMVLDPERYGEGLQRLKRAIRALEGFQ